MRINTQLLSASFPPLRFAVVLAIVIFCMVGAGEPSYAQSNLQERMKKMQETEVKKMKILSFITYQARAHFRTGTCFLEADQKAAGMDFSSCLPKKSEHRVILWGDSHAAHLAFGFEKVLRSKNYDFGFVSALGCAPALQYDPPSRPNCKGFNDYVFPMLIKEHPNVLVLSSKWDTTNAEQMNGLKMLLERLMVEKIRVVVLGASPLYKRSVPIIVVDKLNESDADMFDTKKMDRQYLELTEAYMNQFISKSADRKFISVRGAICDENKCPLLTSLWTPVYFDTSHLTTDGSEFFAKRLIPLILD